MREAVRNLRGIHPYFVRPPYKLRYTYHEIVKQGKHNLPQYEKILPGDKVIEADDFLELLRKR